MSLPPTHLLIRNPYALFLVVWSFITGIEHDSNDNVFLYFSKTSFTVTRNTFRDKNKNPLHTTLLCVPTLALTTS